MEKINSIPAKTSTNLSQREIMEAIKNSKVINPSHYFIQFYTCLETLMIKGILGGLGFPKPLQICYYDKIWS